MAYNFTTKLETPEFIIEVDNRNCCGHFEHKELGDECSGGLWFQFQSETTVTGRTVQRLELVDCDGLFELPKEVATALHDAGYIILGEFD